MVALLASGAPSASRATSALRRRLAAATGEARAARLGEEAWRMAAEAADLSLDEARSRFVVDKCRIRVRVVAAYRA